MITKGIVEEIIDDYNIRVRIPYFNSVKQDIYATNTSDLYIATIATLPNCLLNLQLNDIVYVTFEDHQISKPVIIGQLCRETKTDRCAVLKADTLNVNIDAYLPAYTFIGDVTPDEIKCLRGSSDNLQYQIKILTDRIAKLEEEVNKPKEN